MTKIRSLNLALVRVELPEPVTVIGRLWFNNNDKPQTAARAVLSARWEAKTGWRTDVYLEARTNTGLERISYDIKDPATAALIERLKAEHTLTVPPVVTINGEEVAA